MGDTTLGARVIDRKYLEEISGGDIEFEQEVLATYLETAEGLVSVLEASFQAGDLDSMVAYIHTLKGSSSSIGATSFATICKELEGYARQGDIESWSLRFGSFHHDFDELVSYTKTLIRAA